MLRLLFKMHQKPERHATVKKTTPMDLDFGVVISMVTGSSARPRDAYRRMTAYTTIAYAACRGVVLL
jgi:hypothetical protein